MSDQRLECLREAYLLGTLTPAERQELSELCRHDAGQRDALLAEVEMDLRLRSLYAGEAGGQRTLAAVRHLLNQERDSGMQRTVRAVSRRTHQRHGHRWVMALVAACLVVGLGLWLRPGQPPPAALGHVLVANGATLQRGDSVQALSAGQALHAGDSLSGATRVAWADGSQLGLSATGRLRLLPVEAGSTLSLDAGDMDAHIVPQPAAVPFAITTPQGQAVVLGTRFVLSVDAGGTNLRVSEGRVRLLASRGGELVVSAGQQAELPTGAAPRWIDATGVAVNNPVDAVVTGTWERGQAPLAPTLAVGLNVFVGVEAERAIQPAYRDALAAMAPALLRFARGEQIHDSASHPAGWLRLDADGGYSWDAERIARVVPPAEGRRSELLVSIPDFPTAWRTPDQRLRPDCVERFARLCADLVHVVDRDLDRRVSRWEITRGTDVTYADDPEALADLVLRCAAAMQAVKPGLRLSGPAFARCDRQDWLEAYFARIAGRLDYLSFCVWPSDGRQAEDDQLWDQAEQISERAQTLRRAWAASGAPPVEVLQVESALHNEAPDPRFAGAEAGIFDALVMISAARAGLAASCRWNDMDGWFGAYAPDGSPRPAGEVLALFARHLRGAALPCTSSAPARVAALACPGALVLVNRWPQPTRLGLAVQGADAIPWERHVVTDSGLVAHGPTSLPRQVLLPERSITLFVPQP